MLPPQTIQGFANGRRRSVDNNLALPIRKVGQKPCDIESNHDWAPGG
jgi:hypothetical protein